MVWSYQNADCSLKNKCIVSFIIIFGTRSLPIAIRYSRTTPLEVPGQFSLIYRSLQSALCDFWYAAPQKNTYLLTYLLECLCLNDIDVFVCRVDNYIIVHTRLYIAFMLITCLRRSLITKHNIYSAILCRIISSSLYGIKFAYGHLRWSLFGRAGHVPPTFWLLWAAPISGPPTFLGDVNFLPLWLVKSA